MAGMSAMDMNVASESAYGTRKIEVALVLDNTGSMAGAKITELRKAAKNLVTTLQGVQTPHADGHGHDGHGHGRSSDHQADDPIDVVLVAVHEVLPVVVPVVLVQWIETHHRRSGRPERSS